MQRRDFILNACRACAALALVPAAAALEGCTSTKSLAVSEGVLDVPMDVLGKGSSAVVKATGLSNKLMIVKRADGTYTALELNCPHKNGPLSEKDGQLVCDWHGSTFDMEGAVQKGPSKTGLKTYPVEAAGNVLRVKVA